MVERKTLNLVVVGSIPTGGAYFRGEWPAGRGAARRRASQHRDPVAQLDRA